MTYGSKTWRPWVLDAEESVPFIRHAWEQGITFFDTADMYAWQFAKAQSVAERYGWTRFVSMQNHYNLVYREEEREMLPLCRDQGVAVTPWSPLARGFLAGNRSTKDAQSGQTLRARSDDY